MRLKIGVFGAGGFIGTEVVKYLKLSFDVTPLKSSLLYLDPYELSVYLKNLNIIINLAGHPVSGRWTKSKKRKIYVSRVSTTKNLVDAIALLDKKPIQLINASAIGVYADKTIYDENSIDYAENFLSEVVLSWEKEANEVVKFGTNLTLIRIGVVLSRKGGMYSMIRKIFKIGFGGKLGNGAQGFSFILLNDLVKVFSFTIENNVYGIVNGVCPTPSTNLEFTKLLAFVLRRPAFFSVPSFVLRLLLCEGSSIVLEGQRVIPNRLISAGFTFEAENLYDSLKILEK